MPAIPSRCVVDTNVLISALLQPSGRTAQVLETIQAQDGVVLFSDPTFQELATRLMRAKFDRYATVEIRDRYLADLAGVAEWVVIGGTLRACRDPDDDKLLETAVVGGADWLITGDDDLLILEPFGSLRIVNPRSFLEVMAGGEGRVS